MCPKAGLTLPGGSGWSYRGHTRGCCSPMYLGLVGLTPLKCSLEQTNCAVQTSDTLLLK